MKLDYDNSSTRAMDQFEGDIQVEGKDFHQMMGDFYSMILGGEPDEEEWKLIEEVAREAGVIE
jgi:exonuclease SbcD